MGAAQSRTRRAVFLDRDGVINRNVFNPATGLHEAPLTVADFNLIPGVPAALQQLQAAGFLLFLVSNQPNHAKGKASLADLHAIHTHLRQQLTAMQVEFAAFCYCRHHPEGIVPEYSRPCECRKPSPYFLSRAIRGFHLDPAHSWMIGDRSTDILCGQAAGVRTVLIAPPDHNGREAKPCHVAADLAAAAKFICATTAENPASRRFIEGPAQIPSDYSESLQQPRSRSAQK